MFYFGVVNVFLCALVNVSVWPVGKLWRQEGGFIINEATGFRLSLWFCHTEEESRVHIARGKGPGYLWNINATTGTIESQLSVTNKLPLPLVLSLTAGKGVCVRSYRKGAANPYCKWSLQDGFLVCSDESPRLVLAAADPSAWFISTELQAVPHPLDAAKTHHA